MGKRLYVGSLPFDTTDAQLQELFSACGRVESAKVISDKISGRSKGFGFVEMATDTEAQAAIQKFNGSSVGSRNIVVNEARPMEDRKGGGGGGFKGNRGGGGSFGGGGGRREGGFGGNGGWRPPGSADWAAAGMILEPAIGPAGTGGMVPGGGGRKSPDGESFGNRW